MNEQETKRLVILAGGKGTRLKSVLDGQPKPLAEIAGKSLLQRQIELAVQHGINEVHLMVYHLADHIRDQIGDGSRWGISIKYHLETDPRGTAGCVLEALDELPDRFFVFYGDTLMNVDLDRLWNRHRSEQVDATLLIHPNDHPYDSDLIELDHDERITAFHSVPHPPDKAFANLVNAALYLVEKKSLLPWQNCEKKLDFARDLFPRMVKEGYSLLGYRSREYIKDMGTPDRLQQGLRDLKSGKVIRLAATAPVSTVFLDRDGTLNVEMNRVSDPADLQLISGASDALKTLNEDGRLAVVITNQAVIARGDCSTEQLQEIHNRLETLLGRERAYVDDIYYCPHHPDSGFEGEVPELKRECDCRKPNPGMILQAAEDWNIDLTNSWMIGDTTSDVSAAHRAGIRSVLVRTGHGGRDYRYPVRSQYEFFDVHDATYFIVNEHAALLAKAEELLPQKLTSNLILIGGRSRAGKSTWASVCCEVLRQRGVQSHVLPLDCFLKPVDERGGTVMERFNIPAASDSVKRAMSAKAPTTIELPFYDRNTKSLVNGVAPSIEVSPGDALIVEGVIGLAIPELLDLSAWSCFVECSENTYQSRFRREYEVRGEESQTIESLLVQRSNDELVFVDASREKADQRIDTELLSAAGTADDDNG